MQLAAALGHGQFVIRFGEMVHADIHIAGRRQALDTQAQHGQLVLVARQVRIIDQLLRFEQLRHMGVVVDRDPVRAGRHHLGQGLADGDAALLGQPVDQVDADRTEAAGPGRGDGVERHRFGLDAVDGGLHSGIEILHPEADPVEALAPQRGDTGRVHCARIDLDRIFAAGVIGKAEVRAQVVHQFIHLRVRQIGRRAAAQVQLFDLLGAAQQRRLHADLALEVAKVDSRLVALLRDDLVAGAVVAQRLAERDMQV